MKHSEMIWLPPVLYRILQQNTDRENRLSMPQLLAMLEEEGFQADRRSVYKAINVLKENGVYDNTRIIIAADHGAPELCSFDDMIADFSAGGIKDVLDYNPLFLVKDFNSRGFKTDMSFMTNADTPVLAMKGLISEPVNPFTGKPVNSDAKQGEQPLILSELWDIEQNDGNTFAPSRWYSVHDNIFDLGNWKELDFH